MSPPAYRGLRGKAAHGTDERTYLWVKNSPTIIYHPDDGDMTEVGSYPNSDSPYGALNIAGNIREWVGNWYSDTYYVSSPTSNSSEPNEGENRVPRGREWAQAQRDVRAASRYNQPPKHTTGELAVGLEIVETLLQSSREIYNPVHEFENTRQCSGWKCFHR